MFIICILLAHENYEVDMMSINVPPVRNLVVVDGFPRMRVFRAVLPYYIQGVP